MSEVTSYRTRGTVDFNLPQTDPSLSNEFFTEWQYPDRHRNRSGPLKGEGESGFVTEKLSVGVQSFARLNGSKWQEQPPRPNNEEADRSYGFHLIDLDARNVELISTDGVTDDGVRVYRLEFRGYPVAPTSDSEELLAIEQFRSQTRVTLLINQETFRYVTAIIESQIENGPNIDTTEIAILSGSVITYNFYDYNEPVDIELPTENVGLREDNPLATPGVPHTPTAIPIQNCSERGAIWPGCGIRTAADVEAMLAVFPDDHKIAVGEDVVIVFAFEGPPAVDWLADGFVWHVPTASFLSICVSGSPEPVVRFRGSTETSLNSPEAGSLLGQVLADEVVADLFRTRDFDIKGRCE